MKKFLSKNTVAMRKHIQDTKKWRIVLDRNGVKVLAPKDKVNSHCEFLTITEHPRSPREVFSFIREFKHRTLWYVWHDQPEKE